MIDSDNVLLLHPATPGSGFALKGFSRNAVGGELPGGLVVATVYYFEGAVPAAFPGFFEHMVKPVLAETGAEVSATFATEASLNTFPALPVREGEFVFVWFASFLDAAAYENHRATLAASSEWSGQVEKALAGFLVKPPEVLPLSPTVRSLFKDTRYKQE